MHEYRSDGFCSIQRQQSCSKSEELTMNTEHWTIDNVNPEFLNITPAPQIWFRHTTLLTPKLAKTLNHDISGPQVSFAFSTWRLGTPSRVPGYTFMRFEFCHTRLWRRGHPKSKKCVGVEAPPCEKKQEVNTDKPVCKSMTSCVSRAELFVLLLTFTTHQKGGAPYIWKCGRERTCKTKTTQQSACTTITQQCLDMHWCRSCWTIHFAQRIHNTSNGFENKDKEDGRNETA